MACFEDGRLVEEALKKLATQYRNSCNFQDFITVYLEEFALIERALCDSLEIDIDRLGILLNFPRCWCNIKRKKWFGMVRETIEFFGFTYEDGETEVVPEECITGLDEGYWQLPDDANDCGLAALQNCCTINDPTIGGFCEADFKCDKYPQHEDHCFDDDEEYARLLQAKLLADKSIGSIDDISKVAIILYGEETTIFSDENATIWISLNRPITDHEIFLVDFYKNLIPASNGVDVIIVDGLQKQFGFVAGSPCLEDRYGGFCDGVLMRRY